MVVERRRDPPFPLHTERPPDVRRSQTDVRARVNGDRPLAVTDVALTSSAGREVFGRSLRATGCNAVGRHAVAGRPAWGAVGAVVMGRGRIGRLVVGGRRLRHLAFVPDDPLVQRFCDVHVLPTARTLRRWLPAVPMTTGERLPQIKTAGIARVLATLGGRTWTIAVDGVVGSTGLQVERAFRGVNPPHRTVPRYDPILAHLAETPPVLRVKNRSGHVHDGQADLPFVRDVWAPLGTRLPRGGTVRVRMEGALFRQEVRRWLVARDAGDALTVPVYHWLDLQQDSRAQPTWHPPSRSSRAGSRSTPCRPCAPRPTAPGSTWWSSRITGSRIVRSRRARRAEHRPGHAPCCRGSTPCSPYASPSFTGPLSSCGRRGRSGCDSSTIWTPGGSMNGSLAHSLTRPEFLSHQG